MAKVLITGASGFIGGHLAETLAERGDWVRCLVRRKSATSSLEELGAEILPGRGLDFIDPWGNRIQIVEYPDIQFTKAPEVLRAMELDHLGKSEAARRELADKGIRSS